MLLYGAEQLLIANLFVLSLLTYCYLKLSTQKFRLLQPEQVLRGQGNFCLVHRVSLASSTRPRLLLAPELCR